MPFKPGHSGNPRGRPKGAVNKNTKAFKDAVLLAFQTIGGDDAFAAWAQKNQTEFYKIAARLIPTEEKVEHSGTGGGPLKIVFGGRYKPDGSHRE